MKYGATGGPTKVATGKSVVNTGKMTKVAVKGGFGGGVARFK